jgi:hypothetical protein
MVVPTLRVIGSVYPPVDSCVPSKRGLRNELEEMDKQQVKEIVPTLVGLPVYVEHDVTHQIGSVVESKIIFGSGIEVVLHIKDAAAIKALEENQYLGLSMSHRFSKQGIGPVVQEAIEISVVRKGRREGSWIREIEFVAGVHNCSASQEARHHIYRTAGALCSIGGYTMQPTKLSDGPVPDEIAEVEPPVAEVEPPVAEVEPPVAEVEPPVAEVEPPVADAVTPVADVAPPVVDVAPPVVDVAPPVVDVAPPVVDVAPPVVDVVPPVVDVVPPVVDVVPPVVDVVPPVVNEVPADGTALLSAAATEIEELRNRLAAKTHECIMNAKEYQESKSVVAPRQAQHLAAMQRLVAALNIPDAQSCPGPTASPAVVADPVQGVVACSAIAPPSTDVVVSAAKRLQEQSAVIRRQRETINHTSGFHREPVNDVMSMEGMCNASARKRAPDDSPPKTFGDCYQAKREAGEFVSNRELARMYETYQQTEVCGKFEASSKKRCLGLLRPETDKIDDGRDDVSTADLYPDVMELIMGMTTGKFPGPAEVSRLVESTPMC